MSINDCTGNSTVGTDGRIDEQIADFVDATSEALETAEADEETIEEVEAAGEALVQTLEEINIGSAPEKETSDGDDSGDESDHSGSQSQTGPSDADELDDLRQQVRANSEAFEEFKQEVQDHHNQIGEQRAKTKERLSDVETRVSVIEDQFSAGELRSSEETADGTAKRLEPETYLEDLARLPSRLTEDESPNVRRALFVARDVAQYTRSVPAGRAIKWSELRRVLRAGTDCDAHPQTVKRVMEVLDDFGEDTVELVDRDDREKLICFDEEAAVRLHHLCSEDQSANATHDVVSRSGG